MIKASSQGLKGSEVALYMHSPKRQQMIRKAQQSVYSVGVKCCNEAQYMRRAHVAQVVVQDSAASSLEILAEHCQRYPLTIGSARYLAVLPFEALIINNPIIRVLIFIPET